MPALNVQHPHGNSGLFMCVHPGLESNSIPFQKFIPSLVYTRYSTLRFNYVLKMLYFDWSYKLLLRGRDKPRNLVFQKNQQSWVCSPRFVQAKSEVNVNLKVALFKFMNFIFWWYDELQYWSNRLVVRLNNSCCSLRTMKYCLFVYTVI